MTYQPALVRKLSKEAYFVELENYLINLAIELNDYMKANRSNFSRNQYTDTKRILQHLSYAQGKCQHIILSIRPPVKPPVDGIDALDEDIPF